MAQGKTVLITGSSSGIGQATAARFGEEAMQVGIHYHRNRRGAEETAAVVEEAGSEATIVQGDVSDPDAAEGMVAEIRDAFGQIDILVNNAAQSNRTSWGSLTWNDWNRILSVNTGGVFNVSRHVLPRMAARGSGAVVNVSSTWSRIGGADLPAYTASKGAVNALTRQMCKDYSPRGVRVNAVIPGPIDVEKHRERRAATEDETTVTRVIPVGRYGTPPEVAAAIRFLASDDASYISGTTLVVDGGLTGTSSR